jgi:hypothetical protein
MKKIDTTKLRKGDIILSTSTQPQSKVIRFVINSDISHAMLYVANGSVMDSTSEGVQARNIQKMFYDDSSAIYAYRAVTDIPGKTLGQIVAYVRSETGAPYATGEAAISPFVPKLSGGKNQFCSRLVARAYASVGLSITDNPEFATPADIQRSTFLREIPDVVLEVSTDEQASLAREGDTTGGMRNVINDLLAAVRKIAPSIRVLSDIEPFLLKNPQFDPRFAEAYRKSGYLTYWQVEVKRFPWRYDPVALAHAYHAADDKEELLEYCRETIRHDSDGDFNHWTSNAKALQRLMEEMPLETFRLSLDLYLKLCFNHSQRMRAANVLLKVYGTSSK